MVFWWIQYRMFLMSVVSAPSEIHHVHRPYSYGELTIVCLLIKAISHHMEITHWGLASKKRIETNQVDVKLSHLLVVKLERVLTSNRNYFRCLCKISEQMASA